jgi:DNA topoisomerase-2
VHHVADQLVTELIAHIKKKHKDFKAIKPFQVKQHLFVFVNCLIENPAFDSQTKETLTTKVAAFGSKFELTQKFVDDIVKSTDVVANVVLSAKQKMDNKMAKQLTGKKTSRLLGIEKLEDANDAGTRNAEHCTLILTEGDSAKSLAMAGIEVVGRDRWGVFPLRGKMLNVRDASAKQITENKEIESLVKILGLRFN